MKHLPAIAIAGIAALALASIVHWRFASDLARAAERAAQGSTMVATRCGPIEVQQAGEGIPLLVIHGAGGGHDQGMLFARALVPHGIRVIAMSRFGYLRTPLPADATPAAQADAHVCLLDALGIERAAVMGISAGGLSAMQTAIRHPGRVSALVLVVSLAWRPSDAAAATSQASALAERILLRLVGSDFVFWATMKLAPDQAIARVLATPPAAVHAANAAERARVQAMLESILPVSARADGLRNETRIAKSLAPYALDAIRAPTLLISARDDGYGTYAGAQYSASRIAGAKFVGFDDGGHLLVGHDERVRAEIVDWLTRAARR
ncbi:MAG: putative aminoacrylate hydrolase RutD [Burkholderiaceae bacterium]|nr:putative aminoacrylate hydrolase RutD [Burkholderiaceae bacterium]